MRQAAEVALPIVVDRASGVALPVQIADAIRQLATDAVLRPGDLVPSSRALAGQLGVARGTAVAAYDQLHAEGWLVATPGGTTRMNPRLPRVWTPVRRPSAGTGAKVAAATGGPAPPRIDLRPGRPLSDDLPGAAWRAAWRAAADAPVDVRVPALGWPGLRAAVVAHLRRLRGLACDPGRIAITAGGREGLTLLLHASGIRSVGVEDPGFPSLRRVLRRHGVSSRSLATDDHGLVTSALPEVDPPQAILVTPSHQYPLGGSLPIDRRLALIEWAQRHGVLVIEDDYDSELRYSSEPLPALAALDTDRVALLGTFSKTLTPVLATGYLVLPTALVEAAAAVRVDLGQPVSLVTQRALAAYLDSGALARHIQRMRRIYRRRRDQVTTMLADLPAVQVRPMDGGLHAVVQFDRDEAAVIGALAARGVAVASLGDYWASEPTGARSGFVFGFGGVSDGDLAAGLEAIVAVIGAGRERRADSAGHPDPNC